MARNKTQQGQQSVSMNSECAPSHRLHWCAICWRQLQCMNRRSCSAQEMNPLLAELFSKNKACLQLWLSSNTTMTLMMSIIIGEKQGSFILLNQFFDVGLRLSKSTPTLLVLLIFSVVSIRMYNVGMIHVTFQLLLDHIGYFESVLSQSMSYKSIYIPGHSDRV